ncbi:hypothetical protein NQ318_009498 [Aromia moschata]|uniref:Sulfotransferase domain-containing protein n=1 Tax=Aromia moschata TaxID=1265417 RepID=A0AAV8Z929_9CUCU|nr:hypothetical protein NQ318_009498 [Aromia moschata]
MLTRKPLEGVYGDITDKALGVKHALYEFSPGKSLLPLQYELIAQKILDAPVREDDVWLISFPRTGSTWCQEMVWLIGNNLDFNTATTTLQLFRAPILESSVILAEYAEVFKEKFTDSVEYVNNLPSPRFIKSHLTYHLLPTELHKVKPKIIYTIRNPKDLCVSYYYHCKLLHAFNVDFEVFCELFLNDAIACGGVFNHYLKFWNRRHQNNILILRYEEMKKDTRGTMRKIADFLEKPISDKDLDNLEQFLSLEKMKGNRGCNGEPLVEKKYGKKYIEENRHNIVRKGEIGDWKNHMSPEMSKRFDEWIEKNTLGTGLSFD